MLSEKLQSAINEQIKNELYSGYLYLAMSAYCEVEGWPGFAHWMRMQAEEEQEHALRLFDYVNDRGGRVFLEAIEQPASDFGAPLEIFEEVYAHEQKVTAMIHNLYALSLEENDYATQVMLQWFIDEQVEEEKTAAEIVDLLTRAAGHNASLIMLDRQLGARSED
jgi:ferritin